jgi:hypothetical protein
MAIRSIKTGTFSRKMLVGNTAFDPAATFLIQRNTLTSDTSSITFSSIPSTYKHLQVRLLTRLTATGTTPNDFKLNINGTTSTYRDHHLNGNGSTVKANNDTTTYFPIYNFPRAGQLADTFGAAILDFHDYASTTKNKVFRMMSGFDDNSAGQIWLYSGLWVSTNAIDQLVFAPQSGNFKSGSTFALYGMVG